MLDNKNYEISNEIIRILYELDISGKTIQSEVAIQTMIVNIIYRILKLIYILLDQINVLSWLILLY